MKTGRKLLFLFRVTAMIALAATALMAQTVRFYETGEEFRFDEVRGVIYVLSGEDHRPPTADTPRMRVKTLPATRFTFLASTNGILPATRASFANILI